jgi:hypothetical protein
VGISSAEFPVARLSYLIGFSFKELAYFEADTKTTSIWRENLARKIWRKSLARKFGAKIWREKFGAKHLARKFGAFLVKFLIWYIMSIFLNQSSLNV